MSESEIIYYKREMKNYKRKYEFWKQTSGILIGSLMMWVILFFVLYYTGARFEDLKNKIVTYKGQLYKLQPVEKKYEDKIDERK